jgi:hypothetical protein
MNGMIDLIPAGYRARMRRGQLHRQVIIVMIVGGVIIGGLGWSLRAAVVHRRMEQRDLASLVDETRAYARDAERLAERIEESRQLLRNQRELELPLSVSEVIATLGSLMPESMTLESLELRLSTRRYDDSGKQVRGARPGKKEEGTTRDVLVCETSGVARTDLDVADFVGALNNHPFFDQISLDYSRPEEIRGVPARSFRVSSEISLGVEYVTHVAPALDATEDVMAEANHDS